MGGGLRRPRTRSTGERRAPFDRPKSWRNRPSHLREHRRDGRHARHRLGGERRPAIGVRAGEATAIEINGAAAHTADVLRDVQARMRRLDEDQLLRGAKVMENADHLDVEALRLRPMEDGEAVPLHPLFDLADRDRAWLRVSARDGDAYAQAQDQPGKGSRENEGIASHSRSVREKSGRTPYDRRL